MFENWNEYSVSGEFILRYVVCLLIGGVLSLILLWPTNSLSYNGLGVGSDGKVYIGEGLWIGVYEDGDLVDKFVQNNLGNFYEFTIVDDQIHLWDTSGFHKVLDLQGNEVARLERTYSGERHLSAKEKREYTAEDGRFYKLENGLLKRAKVTCYHPGGSEEVVFRMPLGLYLTKLAFFAYVAGLALWISRLVTRYLRTHR